MNRWIPTIAVLFLSFCPVVSAPALKSDQEKAVEVLDKAIQAYGGEKKLALLKAVAFQYLGKRFEPDGRVSAKFSGKVTLQLSDTGNHPYKPDCGEWGQSLVLLKASGAKMALLGESRIGERCVTGVKVTPESGPEIRLYFDQKTNLLIKRDERTHLQSSAENLVEYLYEDYSEAEYRHPTRVTILRNGIKVEEIEVEGFKKVEDDKQPDSNGEETRPSDS